MLHLPNLFQNVRVGKKDLLFGGFLLIMIVVKGLFSLQGVLFFLGGWLGFLLHKLEGTINRVIPAHEDADVPVRPVFRSLGVVGAYLVFAFWFLITNRTQLANGALLGFGARLLLDASFLLNEPERLKNEFFWQVALSVKEMRYAVYAYGAVFLLLAVIA